VVLKPSEFTPFVGQAIAELAAEAGLPDGVFNLAQGGAEVGSRIAEDPDVDAVIFTGSWATGRKVLAAAEKIPGKLCALEMGGKNAAIVLADADLDLAVRECIEGAFMTSGQRCNSTSRVLVDRRVFGRFLGRFLESADRLVVGHGLSKFTSLGPVVSRRSYDKALEALGKARREGFEPLRPGGITSVPGKTGYYLAPSVHRAPRKLRVKMEEGTYAHDEVFGPDTAIYAVSGLDEALEINNRGLYGLVVSVFGSKRKDFAAAVRRAKTGLVNWNAATSRSSAFLPFGGMARSGNSRPVGSFTPFVTTIPTGCFERRPAQKK
jgi:acyl-CoA reductase-like NAD-dependent aldehyde dehydrogenase